MDCPANCASELIAGGNRERRLAKFIERVSLPVKCRVDSFALLANHLVKGGDSVGPAMFVHRARSHRIGVIIHDNDDRGREENSVVERMDRPCCCKKNQDSRAECGADKVFHCATPWEWSSFCRRILISSNSPLVFISNRRRQVLCGVGGSLSSVVRTRPKFSSTAASARSPLSLALRT